MSLVPTPDKARDEISPTLEADEVLHRVRILIAEDDMHLRAVVRMVLENGGYEVCEARNGREALELLASVPVSLVIADIRMPIMTGAEMTARIRSDPATLNVPVLIMSGYSDQVDCGASAWLHKPFEANHLLAIAASLIKSGQP